MLPILQPAKVRSDHAPDGALVGRAVGMAADVLENGADVQAGAAADAVQGIALLGVGQQARAVIIEQHDMKLLGTVDFTRLPRPAIHGVVAGQLLARAGGGEYGEEKRQIGQPPTE